MLTGLDRGHDVGVLIDAVARHHVPGRFTPDVRLDPAPRGSLLSGLEGI